MAKINTPSFANAVEDAIVFPTMEDPYDYSADNQKLYIAKFRSLPSMNEIYALRRASVAMGQYQQTFACLAGLNVGDPVYPSAANTVALANSIATANSNVIGFCRYKPTTTSCLISHFRYVSGLSGLTVNGSVYLTDAGSFSATPGTVAKIVGFAISTTEALVFGGPSSGSAASSGLLLFPEIDLKSVADYTLTVPGKINIDEVGMLLTTLGGTIVTQPTIRYGIPGTLAKYRAAALTTLLTAVGKRERYTTLLADDAETAVTCGVTVIAAGSSTIKGTPYVRGTIR